MALKNSKTFLSAILWWHIFPQRSHVTWLALLWPLLCRIRVSLWLVVIPHTSHVNIVPEWLFKKWLFRYFRKYVLFSGSWRPQITPDKTQLLYDLKFKVFKNRNCIHMLVSCIWILLEHVFEAYDLDILHNLKKVPLDILRWNTIPAVIENKQNWMLTVFRP